VLKESANDDESHDDEYNRGDDELGIRELIEHSVELKLHCILLCGVSATVKGGCQGTYTQSILSGMAPEYWPELHGLNSAFKDAQRLFCPSNGAGESEQEPRPAGSFPFERCLCLSRLSFTSRVGGTDTLNSG
jgi:hypothetical protein